MNGKFNPAIRIILTWLLSFTIVAIFALVLNLLGLFDDLQTNRTLTLSVNVLLAIISISAIAFMFKKVDKVGIKYIGLTVSRKDTLFTVVAFVVTLSICFSFVWILRLLDVVQSSVNSDYLTSPKFYGIVLLSLIGWIFAASHEEFLARGYVMRNLSGLRPIHIILISSLFFMAMHFPTRGINPYQSLSWLLGGLTYGYIYLKSGSLTVSTIVHASHNLINDMALYNISNLSLFRLSDSVSLADKSVYEAVLCVFLLLLTYLFYGRNGLFTPSENLMRFWVRKDSVQRPQNTAKITIS